MHQEHFPEKGENFLRKKYVVDKTPFLNNILEKIERNKKFICNSRPRRFGKSVTAHMLVAYFSRGADSRELFEPLKCVKDNVFLENLNQCINQSVNFHVEKNLQI